MAKYLCIALYLPRQLSYMWRIACVKLKVYLNNSRICGELPVYSSKFALKTLVFVANCLCIAESVPRQLSYLWQSTYSCIVQSVPSHLLFVANCLCIAQSVPRQLSSLWQIACVYLYVCIDNSRIHGKVSVYSSMCA
jgi:hypothetical protein